jgi:hypothetical protein
VFANTNPVQKSSLHHSKKNAFNMVFQLLLTAGFLLG